MGWSDKTLQIVEQISNANESEGGGVIVILAERDKERQEASLEEFEYEDLGTRVICREGNPLLVADLKKVNAAGRRALHNYFGGQRHSGPSRREIVAGHAVSRRSPREV